MIKIMIVFLEGNINLKTDKFVAVDVDGVGYKIFVSIGTIKILPQEGEKVKLWTHLHVRDNALELYGFLKYAELNFFEMLIQISGVGPKSALSILDVAPLDTLKRAVASGESSYLTRVSGIGKRIAEKIIIELRDKLSVEGGSEFKFKEDEEVFEALKSLGYSNAEARDALNFIPNNLKETNVRLKEALRVLGENKGGNK